MKDHIPNHRIIRLTPNHKHKCEHCPDEAIWYRRSALGNFYYCDTHKPRTVETTDPL